MLCNVGKIDGLFRLTLGSILISTVYYGPQTPWGWFGLIPIATGILCFCPVYGILGYQTCKKINSGDQQHH